MPDPGALPEAEAQGLGTTWQYQRAEEHRGLPSPLSVTRNGTPGEGTSQTQAPEVALMPGQRWIWVLCAVTLFRVTPHFPAEIVVTLTNGQEGSPKSQNVEPVELLPTPQSQQKEKWSYYFPRTSLLRVPGRRQAARQLFLATSQALPCR